MKILWSSNAPWCNSGYGVQTRHITKLLQEAGHQLGIIAWHGLEGGRLILNGLPVYPKGGAPYGQDVMVPHSLDFGADVTITLIDAWVYNGVQLPPEVRWCPYFPVDSEPISPQIVAAVKGAYERIVFSRFAEEEVTKAGMSCLYAPHVVDCDTYKPGDRAEARRRAHLPQDVHITAVVAANKGYPSRKSWPQMLEAWVRFRADHPEAILYLHTLPGASDGNSCNIPSFLDAMAKKYNQDLSRSIMWIDAYRMMGVGIPDEFLADIYRGADVLLNPAMGEGFGVPILEAQACGCPVITGDWTAMSEITFAGWKVPKEMAFPFWITGYDTYQFIPSMESIYAALQDAYDWSQGNRDELRLKARNGALQYHTATVAREHWVPVMQQLEERITAGTGELQLVRF